MQFSLLDIETNETLTFPLSPTEIEVNIGPKIYSFSPVSMGDVEVPKGRKPININWTGLFPGSSRKLPELNSSITADDATRKLTSWAGRQGLSKKLRLIITDTPWNLIVFINAFSPTHGRGHGDVNYKISLTEWRELLVQQVGESETTKRVDTQPKKTTYTVKTGDSLWIIAKKVYGDGSKWGKIHDANKDKIKNPDLIYPGQVLVIP